MLESPEPKYDPSFLGKREDPEGAVVRPVTQVQNAMATTHLVCPNAGYNHQQVLFRCADGFVFPFVQIAVGELLAAHSYLCNRFYRSENTFHERSQSLEVLPLEVIDCTVGHGESSQEALSLLLDQDRCRGFEWSNEPLLRFRLIQFSTGEASVLLFSFHHILLDGRSTAGCCRLLLQNYRQACLGIALEASFTPKQHVSRSELFASDEQIEGWAKHAEAFLPYPPIPWLQVAQEDELTRACVRGAFSVEEVGTIDRFRKSRSIGLHLVLMASWAYALSRYISTDQVCLDVIYHGHRQSGSPSDRRFGMTIESLPLLIDCHPEQAIDEWLRALVCQYIDARDHGADYARTTRKHMPKQAHLQSIFLFEYDSFEQRVKLNRQEFDSYEITLHEKTDVPLLLACNQVGAGIDVELDFDSSLIPEGIAQSLLDLFKHCVHELSSEKSIVLYGMTAPELWSLPVHSLEVPPSLNHVLQRSAERTPEALAIDSPQGSLSYCDLMREVERRAAFLAQEGIGFGSGVCYRSDRNYETTLNLLAILRVGACCIPLDPKSSIQQLDQIVNESKSTCFVAISDEQQNPHPMLRLILIPDTFCVSHDVVVRNCEVGVNTPAFLLYTSGSTGASKGVLCHHGGAANEVASLVDTFEIDTQTRMLQVSNPAFDATIEELFTTFAGSGTLVTGYPHLLESNWETFTQTIVDERVTHLDLTTVVWHQWAQWLARSTHRLPAWLRVVIVGGERALPQTLEQWFQLEGNQTQWINTYGLTETSIVSTALKCDATTHCEWLGGAIPIGYPIANTQLSIVDAHDRPVPRGALGELAISGIAVSLGYVSETTDLLQSDPCPVTQRSFKTGDLVCADEAGCIHYIERKDRQIKINGRRIEPAAIESLLNTVAGVSQSYVTAKESPTHQKRLLAYLETMDSSEDLLARVQAVLSHHPDLCPVRAQCITLHPFPLTSNGKVDAAKLPCPFATRVTDDTVVAGAVSETQVRIIEAFSRTLEIPSYGLDDGFFDCGGDSLSTLTLLDELHRVGIFANTQTIRKAPTPRLLYEFCVLHDNLNLDSNTSSGPRPVENLLFQKLNATQHKDSVIAIHGVDGTFSGLSEIIESIDDSMQVYGIYGLRPGAQLPEYESCDAMIGHYADLVIEHAPYSFLMGYSLGAYFTWQLASELARRGSPTRGIFIIDPPSFTHRNPLHNLLVEWEDIEKLVKPSRKVIRDFIKRKVVRRQQNRLNHEAGRQRLAQLSPTHAYYMQIVEGSRANDYRGCVHLIRGLRERNGCMLGKMHGWNHRRQQLHSVLIDADHVEMVRMENAGEIASYAISSVLNDWLFQRTIQVNQSRTLPSYRECSFGGLRFCSIGAESTVDNLVKLFFGTSENIVPRKRFRWMSERAYCAHRAEQDGLSLLSGNRYELSPSCCALKVPLLAGFSVSLPEDCEAYLDGLSKDLRKRLKWCDRNLTWEETTDVLLVEDFYHRFARPTALKRHGRDAFYSSVEEMKQIIREGGFLVRIFSKGDYIAGILVKPTTYIHEIYILGVKDGDYAAVPNNTVNAIYWFGFQALHQRGFRKVSLTTSTPFPTNTLFEYKAKWRPQIDYHLIPRLPQFVYLNPKHALCQKFFASHEMLFWEGTRLALMTGLKCPEEAEARRQTLRYLPMDTSIYSIHPAAEPCGLAFDRNRFQAKLASQIWKLA